jgi:G3E family GTPase
MSIPLQLVTGFLGSGKTTFLKNYLATFAGQRIIGVIQNEFSESNIDGQELRQSRSGFELLEVNNGSVFCVCLLGSFVESLSAFVDQHQPDELIMEASGMSDPLSVGQIFQSEALKNKVYLDRVWCLVDARNFGKIAGLQTRVVHQIRIADSIIVNKTDLAESSKDDVILQVKKRNPFAEILPTTFANVEFTTCKKVMKFFPADEQAENGRPNLESVVIKTSRLISSENLECFLRTCISGCIRSKGYINMLSGEKLFLQGSFDDYSLVTADHFPAPTEIVLIGNFQGKENLQKMFENLCER